MKPFDEPLGPMKLPELPMDMVWHFVCQGTSTRVELGKPGGEVVMEDRIEHPYDIAKYQYYRLVLQKTQYMARVINAQFQHKGWINQWL